MKLDFDTDGGIGTRATLGVIVLEADETLQPEFARMMDQEKVLSQSFLECGNSGVLDKFMRPSWQTV